MFFKFKFSTEVLLGINKIMSVLHLFQLTAKNDQELQNVICRSE